jgi:hypothetical protein
MLPIMLDHVIQQANVSTLRAGCLAARRRRTLALKQAIQNARTYLMQTNEKYA